MSRSYTFAVTNTSPPESAFLLNTATIAVPTAFSAPTLGAVSAPLGQAWTATYAAATRTVTLRGNGTSALLPGQQVSLPVSSTAPTSCVSTPFDWTTSASNSTTGTAFALSGSQPRVTVGPQTATTLEFATQPSRAEVSKTISPAVTVVAKDASGATATCYNAPVTLDYAANSAGAPAPSGRTADAVNGVATFDTLSISAIGFGYQLKATSGALQSAASAAFDIVSSLVTCAAGQTCSTATITTPTTSAGVTATSGSPAQLALTVVGGAAAPACGAVSGASDVLTHDVTAADRAQTVTIRIIKALVHDVSDNGAAKYDVCFADPNPFTAKSGLPAALNPASGWYEGLLPDCASSAAPCLVSRGKNRADVLLTYRTRPGDPRSIGGIYLA